MQKTNKKKKTHIGTNVSAIGGKLKFWLLFLHTPYGTQDGQTDGWMDGGMDELNGANNDRRS